jgi:hypothetical protein
MGELWTFAPFNAARARGRCHPSARSAEKHGPQPLSPCGNTSKISLRPIGSTWIARFSTVFSTVVENWLENLSLALAFM